MKQPWVLTALLIFAIGCSADSGPVTLPVPFSGTLTGDNGLVVADGSAITQINSLQTTLTLSKEQSSTDCFPFPIFDSNGANVGDCEYCPTSDVLSETVAFFGDFPSAFPPGTMPPVGRRDTYTMPVNCNLEGGGEVSAELQCFEFPYTDPIIPIEEGAELRAGACSGVVNAGTGECSDAVNKALLDGRYVATTRIENGKKVFVRMDKWMWFMPCQSGATTEQGKILAMMFEPGNIDDFVIIFDDSQLFPLLVDAPLYCEGQTPDIDPACGHAILTNLVPIFDPFVGFDTTHIVCQGNSCLTTYHTLSVSFPIPVEVPQFPGAIVVSVTISQTDPIFCRDVTGEFRDLACPAPNNQDDDLANIQLDFRCVNVHDPVTLAEIGTLGSSFIISLPE